MRPLPFSVWKPRRTVCSASRSPGLSVSDAMVLRDAVEHLGGFEQVDLEQLAVEVARVGGEQPLRFLGDLRRGRRRVGDRVDGGREARGVARLELGQHRLGLRDELGVADQLARRRAGS